jgi:hypothetical protein
MPEMRNADTALHRDRQLVTFGRINTDNEHLSNQISVRI